MQLKRILRVQPINQPLELDTDEVRKLRTTPTSTAITLRQVISRPSTEEEVFEVQHANIDQVAAQFCIIRVRKEANEPNTTVVYFSDVTDLVRSARLQTDLR